MELTYKTWTPQHPELGTAPIPIEPYIDPDIFETERDAVFRNSWINVGRVETIPEPGDYFVRDLDVCRTQVLVIRGKDGIVRSFHNMCSHRGNPVAWESRGNCKGGFTCAFHGWAYDTAGKLTYMSDEKNFFDVRKEDLGLAEILTDIWKGFIFVHLAPEPRQTLHDFLGGVAEALVDYPFEELTTREWYTIEETVNWKALLDAQLEGWHVPFLHKKSLAKSTSSEGMLLRHSVLDAFGPHGLLGTNPPPVFTPSPIGEVSLKYGIGVFDGFAYTEPRRLNVRKYSLKGAMNLYFIFPNVIMGLMHDCYWMYNVWPLTVDRTIWEIGVNTVPARTAGERFCQEYNKIGLRDTLMEDSATHERVQRVIGSGAKKYFHFQDEELVLRNFHHAVDRCLENGRSKNRVAGGRRENSR